MSKKKDNQKIPLKTMIQRTSFVEQTVNFKREIINLKLKNWQLSQSLIQLQTKEATRKFKKRQRHLKRKKKEDKLLFKYQEPSAKEMFFRKLFLKTGDISLESIINLKKHPEVAVIKTHPVLKKLLEVVPLLKELNAMIGLQPLKNSILKMACQQLVTTEPIINHIMITGPPGVGKSMCVDIIANIFCKLGILKTGTVVKADRSQLVSDVVGGTAKATKKKIEEAMGGVLLLDEFCAMNSGLSSSSNFVEESINTLNQQLSERKGEFLCVISGYKDEIEKIIFAKNQGLERRFPNRIHLSGYTPEELFEIFMQKIKQRNIHIQNVKHVETAFRSHGPKFNYFAGDVEALLTHCLNESSLGMLNTFECEQIQITAEQIDKAFQELLKSKESNKKDDDSALHLYM